MTGPPDGPAGPGGPSGPGESGGSGGSQARWVLTPGMSWLGRAGTAVILTVCLALAEPSLTSPGEPAGRSADRYVLPYSRGDPTVRRELGLWLADNARIAFDDQITG